MAANPHVPPGGSTGERSEQARPLQNALTVGAPRKRRNLQSSQPSTDHVNIHVVHHPYAACVSSARRILSTNVLRFSRHRHDTLTGGEVRVLQYVACAIRPTRRPRVAFQLLHSVRGIRNDPHHIVFGAERLHGHANPQLASCEDFSHRSIWCQGLASFKALRLRACSQSTAGTCPEKSSAPP
jgi:hypothetical protein